MSARWIALVVGLFAGGAAQAVTSVVDYSEFTDCSVTEAGNGMVRYSRPVCHTSPLLYLADRAGASPGGVIAAENGYEFDLLDFDLVYSFPEIFSVAALDLPASIDPLTPGGYDQLWQMDLWVPNFDYPQNLRLTGYRDGAVVAEQYLHISDSGPFAPRGINDSRTLSELYLSLDGFTGLDRLEMANMTGFEDAVDLGLEFRHGRFWTCMGSCGYLVLDDVALDVRQLDAPAPIPVPAGLLLLLTGAGGLAFFGFRRCRSSEDRSASRSDSRNRPR